MELTDKLYEQVARYVNDEMEAVEKALFETQMQEYEEIAAEVRLYKEIRSISESANKKIKDHLLLEEEEKKIGEEQIREMIAKARKDWEENHQEAAKPVIQRKPVTSHINKKERNKKTIALQRWTILTAAVVIGIICFGTIWYLQNNSSPSKTGGAQPQNQKTVLNDDTLNTQPIIVSNDTSKKNQLSPVIDTATQKDLKKLFATSFKPDKAPVEKEPFLDESFDFYAAKNFDSAIETFEMAKATLSTRSQTTQQTNTSFYIHYYLGISYMADGKRTGNAIAELKEAIQQNTDDVSKIKAQWYLALAYIKLGKVKEARNLLQQVSQNNSSKEFGKKASQLLKELQ